MISFFPVFCWKKVKKSISHQTDPVPVGNQNNFSRLGPEEAVLARSIATGQTTFQQDDPWPNERTLLDGRSAKNPDYLMGHPQSMDEHAMEEGLTGESPAGGGLWDVEVANMEKEVFNLFVHSLHALVSNFRTVKNEKFCWIFRFSCI